VVLVGSEPEWPAEIGSSLARAGYTAERVSELALVPPLLADGGVCAVFVSTRPLGASDLLVFRRLRDFAPRTAIVVVTRTPTDPDLKRAFENGATAFLSWPASSDALQHAIDSRAREPEVL
jgi:DNA-binding NarL/FixJ family response regulator